MRTLKSFHGDPAIKEKYLERIRKHAAADEIIKGKYWQNGKGCAVGCTIHSGEHEKYETELGVPEWLARLEDTIFENLPNELAMTFPARFLESIPVGVDLEPVRLKFALMLLKENADQVKTLDISEVLKSQVLIAIDQVREVNSSAIKSGEWSESAAWSARSAAKSAESAAWSAAESADYAAESAAWSAARSADYAADSAARSAARSADYAARSAGSDAYIRYSDAMIDLLKNAS